jgi:hypothetical protein
MMSTQDMAGANRAIADAQIAVYPISLLGVEASGMGAEARGMTSTQQMFTARVAVRDMMNNLADETGGRAYYGTNDFSRALQSGFEDGSNYYTLAYIPRNSKWNGAFRKIKVEMARRGDSLSYRRGYFALANDVSVQGSAQQLDSSLQPAAPQSTELLIQGTVVPPDAHSSYLLVDTTVDPAGIDFTTDAGGVRHGKLLVLLVALTDSKNGKPVTQPDNPPQTSGSLHLDFTPEQYQSILKSGIHFGLKLPLKPGSYRLRLGVSDMNNHRLGTLDMPVTVGSAAAS